MRKIQRVLGYRRVSTAGQVESAAGMEAQGEAIRSECSRRGWPEAELIIDEGKSGAILDRPGLTEAINRIADQEVDVLVVAKLDRLSRSVVDFSTLLTWITDDTDCELVVLDVGIDSSTPGGELVANVVAAVANWEAKVIGSRTKEALAAIRSRGEPISRPAVADHPQLLHRIRALRDQVLTLQGVADRINADRVPTLRGGTEWRPSGLQAALGHSRKRPRSRNSTLPRPRSRRSRARKASNTGGTP